MENKIVVVTGASGYLGQHVISELINRGSIVRAIVRTDSPPADLALLQRLGAELFTGKLTADGEDLARAFAGADYGIHLIGSVAPPRGGPSIKDLHQSYTQYFADACVRAGLKKAVLVTALGASSSSSSQYLASKQLAEAAFSRTLTEASLPCAVVRPSLIVGRLVGGRDSKLVDRYRTLLKTRPAVPLVGGGVNRLQPVFVGDLARAIVNIFALHPEGLVDIVCSGTAGASVYEIGGPEIMTMKRFVEMMGESLKVNKKLVTLPTNVASIAAALLGAVQSVPLLSADQVKLAQEDMVTSSNALPGLLKGQPTDLVRSLASYS